MRTTRTKRAADSQQISHMLSQAFALTAIACCLAVSARAQTETTLHSFANDTNGYNPVASLTFDPAGNLFGTTSEGGNFTGCSTGCGVVFELSPIFGGGWSESVPYTFTGGKDGANPFVGLVEDAAGNFYGAAGLDGDGTPGYGTIFELSPVSGGGWSKTTLHSFTGGRDGAGPYGNLILDSAGSLYGTAHNGGSPTCDCGVAFKLTRTSSGWKETLLHTFTGKDGSRPSASLIFDSAGNLYGTTSQGGTGCSVANCGTGVAFELSPLTTGGWKETVLYMFKNGGDGGYPNGGLLFDAAGNLYGTTQYGGNQADCPGSSGCGVAFELSPRSSGGWKETALHRFSSSDGANPLAGFAADASGDLYSTASHGGGSNCGVVFKLAPAAGGGWTESTTYTFTCLSDGGYPYASLILDAAGNLYGTTQIGGANGRGGVFEITP
jgi:uncharacterized repeat protein (TIGR03803 family)